MTWVDLFRSISQTMVSLNWVFTQSQQIEMMWYIKCDHCVCSCDRQLLDWFYIFKSGDLKCNNQQQVQKQINTLLLFCRWCSCIGKEVGETVMFFGCRHKNEDYIYQEELEEAERNGVLTQIAVAFSRDQEQKVRLSTSLLLVSLTVNVSCDYKIFWYLLAAIIGQSL